jgi:hypothetical protein
MAKNRDRVFISYSHADHRFLDQLLTHLKAVERPGRISSWSDKQITPGAPWFNAITEALASSAVAVLLVSKDFLASDFIHEHELGPILREAERGGVQILWIPVRACYYQESPLARYQALISPDKPLAEMKAERDRAWVRICEEIRKAVAASGENTAESAALRIEVLLRLAQDGDKLFSDNQFAGTKGRYQPITGYKLRFKHSPPDLAMSYMAHLGGSGDTPWVKEGTLIETKEIGRAVEGFAVRLEGPRSIEFSIEYMAHLSYSGDTAMFRDGQFCGTRGQSRPVEGMLVRVVRRASAGLVERLPSDGEQRATALNRQHRTLSDLLGAGSSVWRIGSLKMDLDIDENTLTSTYKYRDLRSLSAGDMREGFLKGVLVENVIVFEWTQPSLELRGVGYWRVQSANVLDGQWFYETELPDYRELVANPSLLIASPIAKEKQSDTRRRWTAERLIP